MSSSWDRSDADDLFVRVRPDDPGEAARPEDRGWRLALRGEYPPDGRCWLDEEQVLPERVKLSTANRILATHGSVSMNHDERVWVIQSLLEFGGDALFEAVADALDEQTAERWMTALAQRIGRLGK